MKKILFLILFSLVAIYNLNAQCLDETITDEVGLLISSKNDFQTLVNKLQNESVDLKLAVFKDVENNMDLYVDRIAKKCSNLQNPSGEYKNNLIILAICPSQRKLGLYYGHQWDSKLDKKWPSIQREMKPALRDQRWNDAFVYGLKAIDRELNYVPEPSKPIDFTPFLAFLKWLVIVLVTLVGGYFILKFIMTMYNEYKETQQARRNCLLEKAKAEEFKSKIETLFEDINFNLNLLKDYKGLGAIQHSLKSLISEKESVDITIASYTGDNNPENSKLKLADYKSFITAYQSHCVTYESVLSQLVSMVNMKRYLHH